MVMPRRTWWWMGGSVLVALALWVAWSIGPVPPATVETQVRLRIWLPGGQPGLWWLAGMGGLAALLVVIRRWQARRRTRRSAAAAVVPPPAPQPQDEDGPSAFAVDPWEDTVPVVPEAPPHATRAEQVAALQAAAEHLLRRGRLRAAREAYVQAYELAVQAPPLRGLADELATRILTLERRLAQQARRAKAIS